MDLPIKILIFGKTNSGKTHLMINTLIFDRFYKKFSKIFLLCPEFNSPKNKETYGKLGIPCEQIITSYDEMALQKLWKLKKLNPKIESEQWLIVFDDIQTEPEYKKNKSDSIINKIACRGRHRNISVFILFQSITGCDTIMRSAADELYLFPLGNKRELDSFYEEFGRGSKKEFLKFLESNSGNWIHLKNYTNKGERKIIEFDDSDDSNDSYDSYDSESFSSSDYNDI